MMIRQDKIYVTFFKFTQRDGSGLGEDRLGEKTLSRVVIYVRHFETYVFNLCYAPYVLE